jgi:hypothetical protein
MDIVNQIADTLVQVEQETETRQEVYDLLLLAFLEIKKLQQQVSRLEAEVLNQ